MKDWQFNVLFLLACGGAVVLLFGDKIGVEVKPEVISIFGLVMAYVLTRLKSRDDEKKAEKEAERLKAAQPPTTDGTPTPSHPEGA